MLDRTYSALRGWVCRSRASEFAFVLALGAALSVGLTAPWRPDPATVPSVYTGDSEFFAQFDAAIWTYMLAWGAHHPSDFYSAPILLPVSTPLAATDPRLTEGLWSIPLFRLFPPLQAWGFTLWIALAATAVGTYYAGRLLSGSRWGGVATMVLFAFGLFRVSQLARVEAIFAPFLALAVAALIRYLDTPTRKWAALSAVFLAAALVEYSYTAVALALTVPPVLLYGLWRRRIGIVRGALPLAAGVCAAAIIMAPVAWIYASFHADTGIERALINIDYTSAHVASWLTAPGGIILPPFGPVGDATPDNNLFPGIVACGLAAFGIRALWARSREGVLIGVLALLLSFGTLRFLLWELGIPAFDWPTPYEFLYDWLLPLKAIRAPARFGVLTHIVVAFAGAMAIVRLVRLPRGWVVAAAVLAVAFLEARTGMTAIPAVFSLPEGDQCSTWIAGRPGKFAVLEAPMGRHKLRHENLIEARAMLASLQHGKPTPNGGLAANFRLHESIAANVANPAHAESRRVMQALGVRYVIARGDHTVMSYLDAGCTPVYHAGGSAVFEVPDPLPVPANPRQLIGRLASDPIAQAALSPTGSHAGRILPPAGVTVECKKLFHLPVQVHNTGSAVWMARSAVFGTENGDVAVGVRCWQPVHGSAARVLNPRGKPLVGIGPLPWNIAPGEVATVIVPCFTPPRPGLYRVELDFFVQGAGWVSPTAKPPATIEVTVR
jgi:hypothetical protein